MADEVDLANEQTERMLQALLVSERKKAGIQIMPRKDGTCFNDCGDPVIPGAAFCSKECAEDVEKRMKVSGLSGALAKVSEN